MNDNRYAPPSAPVSDIEAEVSLERPRVVVRAVQVLWAAFALGLPGVIHDFFYPQPDLSRGMTIFMALVGLAITFAIAYWLNTAAWKGRGYARWVMAVLSALGLAAIAAFHVAIAEAFAQVPWYLTTLSGLTMILNVVGNVMLFAPTANAWYRAMRASR